MNLDGIPSRSDPLTEEFVVINSVRSSASGVASLKCWIDVSKTGTDVRRASGWRSSDERFHPSPVTSPRYFADIFSDVCVVEETKGTSRNVRLIAVQPFVGFQLTGTNRFEQKRPADRPTETGGDDVALNVDSYHWAECTPRYSGQMFSTCSRSIRSFLQRNAANFLRKISISVLRCMQLSLVPTPAAKFQRHSDAFLGSRATSEKTI